MRWEWVCDKLSVIKLKFKFRCSLYNDLICIFESFHNEAWEKIKL